MEIELLQSMCRTNNDTVILMERLINPFFGYTELKFEFINSSNKSIFHVQMTYDEYIEMQKTNILDSEIEISYFLEHIFVIGKK